MELRICFTGILFYFFLIFLSRGFFNCLDFLPPPPPSVFRSHRLVGGGGGGGIMVMVIVCEKMRGGSYFLFFIFYGYTDLYRIYRWMV